jgi:hypothetical protein
MGRGGREGYRIAVIRNASARASIRALVSERLTEDEQLEPLAEILVRC